MTIKQFGLYFLITISFWLQAQEKKVLNQLSLTFNPSQVSVDRLGGIYLFGNKKLIHLDANGMVVDTGETLESNDPLVVEAWNPLRIWIYDGSTDKFEVQLFDHFLDAILPSLKLDSALAINPLAIIPGNDNHTAWIMDMDYSVRFIELLSNKVISESEPLFKPGTMVSNLQFRAHQGFLFILNKGNEILVINRTGKVTNRIPSPMATWLSVLGEDIYFHCPGKLTFVDIYSGDSYQVQVSETAKFAIATDERIFEIENMKLSISSFKPKQN